MVRLENFVPADHPLRPIRQWVNDALAKMDSRFSLMCEADVKGGPASRQKLIRAMLLQVLYSVRTECQLVERIQYNLLFRWFVGLAIEDSVWNHSVFSKNRDWLIEHDAVTELFNATVEMAEQRGLRLASTSAWMARCSRPGPAIRACGARTARTIVVRPTIGVASREATLRTNPRPTPSRGCTAKAMLLQRCPATWAMC